MVNSKCIESLSTTLVVLCIIQIGSSGTLLLTFPDLLTFTRTITATAATLVAAFVTLPTAIRLKTSQFSFNMGVIYGYSISYQKLALGISIAVHAIATLLPIIFLILSSHSAIAKHFLKAMSNYRTQPTKAAIDNVQWALQCCGSGSYSDWFRHEWRPPEMKKHYTRNSEMFFARYLVVKPTDIDPNERAKRHDAVPFSCCSRQSTCDCVRNSLMTRGTLTINEKGCTEPLKNCIWSFLIFQAMLNGMCLPIEIFLLLILGDLKPKEEVKSRSQSTASPHYSSRTTTRTSIPTTKSGHHINFAEITPSEHSEVSIF